MKHDCFYEVTITKLKPIKNDFYFSKREDKWYVGYFDWPDVLQYVEEWYERGADAVELKMISQNQFDKKMKPYTSGH